MDNDSEPKARFTGIFIPVEILNMGLTPNEMILLSYIDALDNEEHGGCFAKNSHFAKMLKLKENTIIIMLGKLKELELIEQVSFDGRRRIIRACKENWFKKTTTESRSALDLNQGLPVNKIKVCPSLESTPLNIYSKEDRKEDTLSTLSNGETIAKGKSAIDERVLFFISEVQKKDPNFRLTPSKQKEWLAEIQAMQEKDGRSWEDIKELISYAQSDPFWASRSNTPKNLRRHATTILTQMKSSTIEDNEESDAVAESLLEKQTIENYEYANSRKNLCKAMIIHDNRCEIKVSNSVCTVGYAEDNFKEKLDNIISKIKLKRDSS